MLNHPIHQGKGIAVGQQSLNLLAGEDHRSCGIQRRRRGGIRKRWAGVRQGHQLAKELEVEDLARPAKAAAKEVWSPWEPR